MPYPTAETGDVVTYKNNAGVQVPALAASADGGDGLISLFVDDPAGAYFVHVVPADQTGALANSWKWPANTGGVVSSYVSKSTTSYVTAATDRYVAMSDDAARTISATIPPAGATLTVVDTSGSSTSAHTITLTAATGTLHGNGVITPGTNTAMSLLSDGTDLWLLFKQ